MSATPLTAAIFGCAGPHLGPEEAAFFRETRPVGFILFDRNIEAPEQLRALCAALRAAAGHDAVILMDQEGGRVQRLRPPLAREWPPALDHVTAMGKAAERAMYLRYSIIAAELVSLGLDGNCVPVLDVVTARTHPVLRNRCYGADADLVTAIGTQVAQAHLDAGVLPVMKHMPGQGRAVSDSHLELPRVSASLNDLAVDFAPFKFLSHLPAAMTAHVVYEALDDRAATVSPTAIAHLRTALGFGGLLMTDDLSMEALTGTVAQRSEAALAAGCDVILHCNGDLAEMRAVAGSAGALGDAARRRAEQALAVRKGRESVDFAALEAELEALEHGRLDG